MIKEAMRTVRVIAYNDETGASEVVDLIRCPFDFTTDDYSLCRLRDDHVFIQDTLRFEEFNPFGYSLATYTRPDWSHADEYMRDCYTYSYTGENYDW